MIVARADSSRPPLLRTVSPPASTSISPQGQAQAQAHSPSSPRHPAGASGGGGHEKRSLDENECLLVLQMALKCADLGHLAADLPVHLK